MTYGPRNIVGVLYGKRVDALFLTGYRTWPSWARTLYDFVLGCHLSHSLDFAASLICYTYVWPLTFPHAHTFNWDWMKIVIGYGLCCEVILFGFWHWMVYSGQNKPKAVGPLAPLKFNPVNQYYGNTFLTDLRSNHLVREITLTTLGWIQSSLFQCFMMWVWANSKWGITTYEPFFSAGPLDSLETWKYNAYSIGSILVVTYWRELHFYWVHRMIHPWNTKVIPDIGRYLYKYAHSWHHKSENPGPWSGLSMHPLEHFFYYTCSMLPLFLGWFTLDFIRPGFRLSFHPMHHLYAKFHADIAPIGGHDGYTNPGGDSDYHYLHHAAFECNYGVPFPVDFDSMFGTWVELDHYRAVGNKLRLAKRYAQLLASPECGGVKEKALAALAKEEGKSVADITTPAATGATTGKAGKAA